MGKVQTSIKGIGGGGTEICSRPTGVSLLTPKAFCFAHVQMQHDSMSEESGKGPMRAHWGLFQGSCPLSDSVSDFIVIFLLLL